MARKTLGKMTKTRVKWEINPTSRVVKDKTKYNRKQKHKKRLDKDSEQ